ncbi:hypothetical protein [Actinomadura xylanilytica]|uniref:hypothetical protein n=1 Tax=Actinomadura xylanilytica TaxID=887459 RepID=UPI00255A9A09|nr:hypothetical protein [Actinomadura xylanilytica]MDL4771217.1 hypothetical protein [Actinomadura xylanilytica]
MATRRSLALVTGVSAVTGAALIPLVSLPLRDRLPDPIATHWSGGGPPDGSGSLTAALLICCGMWATICAGALVLGWSGWGRRAVRTRTVASLFAGAVFTAGVLGLILNANLDRSSWRDAGGMGAGGIALLLLASAAGGLIGALLGRVGADSREPAPGAPRRIRIGAGERAVWIGYVHSRSMILLGWALTGLGALGVLLALVPAGPLPRSSWSGALALVIGGVAALALSSARVTVDARGLGIAAGPLRLPIRRIPLNRIGTAWAEDRSPAQAGGWGYRVGPAGTTMMLRGGECLVVENTGGRRFAVSVDDAERGASLLNSLRESSAT